MRRVSISELRFKIKQLTSFVVYTEKLTTLPTNAIIAPLDIGHIQIRAHPNMCMLSVQNQVNARTVCDRSSEGSSINLYPRQHHVLGITTRSSQAASIVLPKRRNSQSPFIRLIKLGGFCGSVAIIDKAIHRAGPRTRSPASLDSGTVIASEADLLVCCSQKE
jgi:hypothetical protein